MELYQQAILLLFGTGMGVVFGAIGFWMRRQDARITKLEHDTSELTALVARVNAIYEIIVNERSH